MAQRATHQTACHMWNFGAGYPACLLAAWLHDIWRHMTLHKQSSTATCGVCHLVHAHCIPTPLPWLTPVACELSEMFMALLVYGWERPLLLSC